ncbi:hypothetical protein G7075_14155 [Phycicoccus sp. HDW14]|uniref:hypothetical protein n=1 Tax=Phycicoccus sp. HDW14 TaxID=2714941 RepID=UPI00140BEA71|nr:hypothetical protein [Phycicoccus sp. HDW14]QIM22013.1 hypothetical protein G7075_14155 [Phycicoccus sp. HDW14]
MNGFADLFADHRLDLRIITPEEFSADKASRSDYGVFDLSTPAGSPQGLVYARKYIAAATRPRLIVASRFFELDRYRDFEKTLSPIAAVKRVSKTQLALAARLQGSSSKEGARQARATVRAIIEELDRQSELLSKIPATPPVVEYDGPIDAAAFYGLSRADRSEIALKANGALRDYLHTVFRARKDVEWATVGIPTGEILEWGEAGESAPRSVAEIVKLSQRAVKGASLPLTFFRPQSREV